VDPTRFRRQMFSAFAVLLIYTATGTFCAAQGKGSSRASTAPSREPPPVLSGPDPRNPVMSITGAVMQEDGIPAPLGSRVECICSARTKRSAAVDSRGFFSLQIGGTTRYSTLTPDPNDDAVAPTDVPPNKAGRRFGVPAWVDTMPSANLMGCELRAVVSGFRSNTVVLQETRNVGQFDVGTILICPLAKVPGTLVSVTTLQAPKQARKALERAEASLQKNNIEKARKELETAIEAYPKYAAAWFTLGGIYELEGHVEDARDAYKKAVAADEHFVKPYIRLARLAGIQERWKEVAEITDHALSLDPLDFPEAYYLNSMAYYSLHQLDPAERSARKVLRLDSVHRLSEAFLILAEILEQKLDFAGALEQLESYLRISPNSPSADRVRARVKELAETAAPQPK
jgi:hypothetical protein